MNHTGVYVIFPIYFKTLNPMAIDGNLNLDNDNFKKHSKLNFFGSKQNYTIFDFKLQNKKTVWNVNKGWDSQGRSMNNFKRGVLSIFGTGFKTASAVSLTNHKHPY